MHTSFGSVYLDRYGNNWSHTVLSQFLPLAQQHGLHYGNCLCVPVFDEIQALDLIWQATLAPLSLKAGKPNLVIILGNYPETATKKQIQTTRQSLAQLSQTYDCLFKLEGFAGQLLMANKLHFLVLHAPAPLPVDQGVGLARKMLVDIAVGLVHQTMVQNPWIGTTDADARVPNDYWQRLESIDQPAGLGVFPYLHLSVDENQDIKLIQAHTIYEAYLRQYQQALSLAMPEYAFATLGSLYVIHAHTYEKVRGYPPKAAGEDFYLLNKIVKIAKAFEMKGKPIVLDIRASNRTPFGTGPSVQALMDSLDMNQVPLFYQPEVLRHWQVALQSVRAQSVQGILENKGRLSHIPAQLQAKLHTQYLQCKTERQRHHAMITLMDGLRCQQLLRQLHEGREKLGYTYHLQLIQKAV